MAIKFVNANGSQTSPYETREKGANTIGFLLNLGVISGDIFELTDDAEIDDSGTSGFGFSEILTLRSYSGNTNKPLVKTHPNNPIMSIARAVIQNIRFYKASPTGSNFLYLATHSSGGNDISDCEFDAGGGTDSNGMIKVNPDQVIKMHVAPIIERNLFKNGKIAIQWDYQAGGAPS